MPQTRQCRFFVTQHYQLTPRKSCHGLRRTCSHTCCHLMMITLSTRRRHQRVLQPAIGSSACKYLTYCTNTLHCVSKKVPTFKPIFKIFAPLESVCSLLQNPFDTTRLTLGMLLYYLGKLEIQIFADI